MAETKTKEQNSDLAEKIEKEDKTPAKRDAIRDLIERHKHQFELALAGTIDTDKFARVALTAIRDNKKLQEASVPSLLAALLAAAQLGLEPHGPLEHCYLVPYAGQVQLIIGYRGLEQLAYRSGMVASINARVVREGDYFEWEFGTSEHLTHRPKAGVGGAVTHAYAIARLVTGGTVLVVLFREDIDRVRSKSASGDKKDSAWATDFDQMARKSAIRALFKDLPVSTESQRALGYDEKTWESPSEVMDPDVIDVEGEEI